MTCDLYFVTTKDNGDTREETKNDKRKSSGETVGVAFFQTKLNKWDKRFVTMRLSKTKDSFQGRLDSNVYQSIMSRMVKGRIWNKPSYHRRPKPGICTISINCLLIMIETTICTSQHKRKTSLCSKGSDNVKYFRHDAHCFQNIQTLSRTKKGTFPDEKKYGWLSFFINS